MLNSTEPIFYSGTKHIFFSIWFRYENRAKFLPTHDTHHSWHFINVLTCKVSNSFKILEIQVDWSIAAKTTITEFSGFFWCIFQANIYAEQFVIRFQIDWIFRFKSHQRKYRAKKSKTQKKNLYTFDDIQWFKWINFLWTNNFFSKTKVCVLQNNSYTFFNTKEKIK